MECNFNVPWIGKCKNEAEHEYCEKHKDLYCVSCGKKATKGCSETMGAFVCGAPLCDDCEHTICENGCNSGAPLPDGYRTHCKKGEQVYKVWIETEYIKEHGIDAYNKLLASTGRASQ